jgi:hypothetical protein
VIHAEQIKDGLPNQDNNRITIRLRDDKNKGIIADGVTMRQIRNIQDGLEAYTDAM